MFALCIYTTQSRSVDKFSEQGGLFYLFQAGFFLTD